MVGFVVGFRAQGLVSYPKIWSHEQTGWQVMHRVCLLPQIIAGGVYVYRPTPFEKIKDVSADVDFSGTLMVEGGGRP